MNFYDVIFAQQKTKADSKYFGEISDAINVLNGTEGTYLPSEMGAAIIDAIPDVTVTDSIVSVTDAAAYPAEGLEFAIEPVQEGSGAPSPTNIRPISGWTGVNGERTGKNLIDLSSIMTKSFINYKGTISFSDDWSSTDYLSLEAEQTYALSGIVNSGDIAYTYFYDSNKVGISGILSTTYTFTTPQDTKYCRISLRSENPTNVQLELGNTATTYEPYQGTSIPITFPTEAGTVYGGKVDVVNGKLLVYPEYDSYSGETLTGKWISSMDTYAAGTTPTIGAQVVDLSGAGTEYDITPQQVQMLLGDNNVWCDTGDTTLEYKVDLGRYIDKIKSQQLASTLSTSPLSLSKSAIVSTDGADADEIEEADESVLHDEVKVSEEAEELTLKKEITEELAETEKVEDIKETEEHESEVEE